MNSKNIKNMKPFRLLAIAALFATLLLISCQSKEQSSAPPAPSEAPPAASGVSEAKPAPAEANPAENAPAATPTAEEPPAQSTAPGTRPAQPTPARVAPKDPNVIMVRMKTTKGDIDIELHKDWAPLGVARFRELVDSGYFDGARFFRVVPGFVVQFGIAANPLLTAKWDGSEIQDDPVLQSNTRGIVTFATAGRNTRTTQLFINLGDNPRLDNMGFAPIGRVVRGMDSVDSIDSRYGEAPQQPRIEDEGEAYLSREFPNLDKIVSARVID
ncbi:MAG: peptidylprolyl isomerase [Bryobacterales bacterium]|nr:peptidylprolyl isomerase [Bryobacterales bacterium]